MFGSIIVTGVFFRTSRGFFHIEGPMQLFKKDKSISDNYLFLNCSNKLIQILHLNNLHTD